MPRVKLFKEEEVLQKAMELFWKKGFHATSIGDLVKYLGINRGSLYGTFGGKQELFDQAFERYRKERIAGTKAFLHSHKDVKEGIRKMIEMGIAEALADEEKKGCFISNSLVELEAKDDKMNAKLIEHKEIVVDMLYTYLQTGNIDSSKDLKVIANLLFTLMNGINLLGKIEKDHADLMASVDAVLSLLD